MSIRIGGLSELRGQVAVTAQAILGAGNDVGDVGCVEVLFPGGEISDGTLVASGVLASSGSLAPDDCLDVCWKGLQASFVLDADVSFEDMRVAFWPRSAVG